MRILLVKPDKEAIETEIKGDLGSLQEIVGGHIQAVFPFDDPVALICNDEGKLTGLPLNRALYDDEGHLYDIVHVICGVRAILMQDHHIGNGKGVAPEIFRVVDIEPPVNILQCFARFPLPCIDHLVMIPIHGKPFAFQPVQRHKTEVICIVR